MNGCYLNRANLKNSYLKGACLNGAYLNGTNLEGAYLCEAYLFGAYLKKAFLQNVNFRGAYFNNNTRFDADFNPLAVGMAKVVEECKVKVEDLLDTLNSISQCSIQLLGNIITVKYWELARPDIDWLKKFQIDRHAQITFIGNLKNTLEQKQLDWSQQWIDTFIKFGSEVIHDFSQLINLQKRRQLISTINSSTIKF
jgi:uncharacterized protein YjbI with pentapeptide repeats